ncbi:hypothetical protein JB92DRAFT_3103494 [Gautieria morchelliformis]|nr:hypothetical protein JB92DRAFT_3103494 [Gautieria morchelliformis]
MDSEKLHPFHLTTCTHTLSFQSPSHLQGATGLAWIACAHLLVLCLSDFSSNAQEHVRSDVGEHMDVEDESYWEDVHSGISLLMSTLEDASAHLTDAVADMRWRKQLEAEIITDEESCADSVPREEFTNSSFQWVTSLKEDAEVASRHPRDPKLHLMALQSYEWLRRELGLALRECERGGGALLEIVQPSTADHLPEDEAEEDEPPALQDEH